MMIRNCFVREEEEERTLIIGSGILPEWLGDEGNASFGPTPTLWGTVSVHIRQHHLTVAASWLGEPPRLSVAIPGFLPIETLSAGEPIPLTPAS